MSLREDLRNVLGDEELVNQWDEIISSTLDDDSLRLTLLDWIKGYRDEFQDFPTDVDDPDEVRDSVLHRYIELKCKWTC